jgi:hypothetical protein
MKNKRLWLTGILLAAAGTILTLETVSAPASDSPIPEISITDTAPIEEPQTNAATSTPAGGCGFMWATHDNPELSAIFGEKIKAIDPNAIAYASSFGEDCVYADGTSTFGAMETDFYVRLPVAELSDEDAFGNFAAQVMEMVLQIPRDKVPGPNYGFVEFSFEKSEADRKIVRIPIQRYRNEAQGKTGAELIQLFSSP